MQKGCEYTVTNPFELGSHTIFLVYRATIAERALFRHERNESQGLRLRGKGDQDQFQHRPGRGGVFPYGQPRTLDNAYHISVLGRDSGTLRSFIDGQDIWPLLSDSTDETYLHKPFYYYRDTGLYAVRSGKWKLVVPHTYGSIEGATLATRTDPGTYAKRQTDLALYDLERDPGETTNLAASHPDVVARLEELLEESRQDLGDSLAESKIGGMQ